VTAKTYVRYDREVLYDDPEWIPVPMKRQVLARVYEVRGILNGIAVIEHEMTARNQADALQRLRERYRRLHDVEFETGEVTPLAFAELRFQYRHDAKRRTDSRWPDACCVLDGTKQRSRCLGATSWPA
jgi:hypothetical protein